MKKIVLALMIMLIAVFSAKALGYTVYVPPGTTNTCYIAGDMNGWIFAPMTPDPSNPYKFTIDLPAAAEYKYCCGPDWSYVEKDEWGNEMSNRSYSSIDYVATWASTAGNRPLLPDGINIVNETTVTFILCAPGKSTVNVVGDFVNNVWDDIGYPMKRYGDYWWCTIDELQPGIEYAFQYKVDGTLYVGDPYSEKVLNPWHDDDISSTTYPENKTYPAAIVADKDTHGVVSVFQTNKTPYNWKYDWTGTGFQPPRQDKLVIYELLIRDFTSTNDTSTPDASIGNLNGAMSKLDYLQGLGINAIELMPTEEFDGNNSWGYDPCFFFAMDKVYGTRTMYKDFIDECHRRGIAVILDVVYNHATGLCPFAKLYWDSNNNTTTADNPWFNVVAPHDNSVFSDFNHQSPLVRNYFKRNLHFLRDEYHFDGFRFDMAHGLMGPATPDSNNPSNSDILKEYYSQVKTDNPNGYMIIEFWGDEGVRNALNDLGLMPWTNKTDAYDQAIMGYQDNSDFNGINGWTTNWTYNNVVGYMESHDEERLVAKAIAYGATNDIKTNLTVQMERAALCAAFFLPLPGPKMIWQFGELGYDYSILYGGDRTAPKPAVWDMGYDKNEDRKALYDTYAKLIKLRDIYSDAFDTPGAWNEQFSSTDWIAGRRICLNSPKVKMVILGNFQPDCPTLAGTSCYSYVTTYPNFPATGIWYDYMTGEEMNVTNTNMTIDLAPNEFKIYIHEDDYVWKTTATNTNWNTVSNWEAGQIPNATSSVTIPSGANYYPDLSAPVEVHEIHFQPGAQIGNQSLLTGKAFVQYDLSVRNKWQMLSMPLGQAYPADFSFGGYPLTWVRAFTTNANGDDETKSSTIKGGWTTLQKRDAPFTYGDAFVLSLDSCDLNSSENKGLKLLNSINELPYFQQLANGSANQALYKNIYPAQTYDGSGQSTFYYFDANNGNEINYSNNYTVARTDAAYQLLNTATFNKNVTFSDGFALVGNPYMATLNFDELYKANSSVIAPNFYIWVKNDNGYTVYSSVAGEAVGVVNTTATSDNLIAPLQGFIIQQADAPSGSSITFNGASPMTTVNPPIKLRSSENNENKLRILAQNPVAGVRTLIAQMEGGQAEFGNLDARKIMNGISDVPEIYTLKPSDNKSIATAVNIVNAGDLLIPIGLATSYTGDITLTFTGMDSYDATLTLIDAVAGKEVNLTGLASSDYTFNYTPTVINGEPAACEDRFFIRISNAPTGIPEIMADKVNVFESNGVIRVISGASNPIKEVAVYNLQGALVYKATAVNAISYTLDLKRSAGVYIVKVISEKNIDAVKLVMK